jgi:group I intron endonuclease
MKEKIYCLYCHTNKINNKKYIGITKQTTAQRWGKGTGYKGCPKFEKAIKKYGWNNFEHEVLLSGLTQEEACKLEKEYIKKYNTIEDGYNILTGGFENDNFTNKPVNHLLQFGESG